MEYFGTAHRKTCPLTLSLEMLPNSRTKNGHLSDKITQSCPKGTACFCVKFMSM